MPSNSYTFNLDSVEKIKRDHETLKNQARQLQGELAQIRAQNAPTTFAFFRLTSVLSASEEATDASGDQQTRTFGEGKGDLMKIHRQQSAPLLYELTKTDQNYTLHNFGKLPIPSGKIVPAHRLSANGIWVVSTFNQTSLAVAPSGGISARSGSTAGSADCHVYYLDSGAVQNAGSTIRVYNWSQTAVAGGAYITIKMVGGTSEWVVDAEDCAE